MRAQELTNEQILNLAPSVGAASPYHKVSNKYQFFPSLNVVNLFRDEGWYPVKVQEVNTRSDSKGYQKHLVRFRYPDLTTNNGEFIEAVMINSHDRSAAYQFLLGIYRTVCANGLIVGDTFEKVVVKHIGHDPREIIDASYKILEAAPVITQSIDKMKTITLNDQERKIYAESAIELVYNKNVLAPIEPYQLLKPRRSADAGTNLWTTFNTVQENIMKGGISGRSPITNRRTTTRKIKNIDRDVKLNKALWSLAEKMKELKLAT